MPKEKIPQEEIDKLDDESLKNRAIAHNKSVDDAVNPPADPPKDPPKEPEAKPEIKPEVRDPSQHQHLPDRPVEGEQWWERKKEKERIAAIENGLKELREGAVTKKDLDELKVLVSDLKGARTADQKQDAFDDLAKFAEDKGVDPDLVREIARRATEEARKGAPSAALPPEMDEALAFFKEQKGRVQTEEAQRQSRAQWDAKFEEEYAALAGVNESAKAIKEDLRKLYFSERYNRYALADIFKLENANLATPSRKTMETGGAAKKDEIVLDKENPAQVAEMYAKHRDKMTPEQRQQARDIIFSSETPLMHMTAQRE